jgi:hypothetical protein
MLLHPYRCCCSKLLEEEEEEEEATAPVEQSEGDDDTTAESEFGCGDIARVDAIIEKNIFRSRAAVLFPPPPATFPTTTDKGSALAHTMLILKHSPPSLFVQFPIEQQ